MNYNQAVVLTELNMHTGRDQVDSAWDSFQGLGVELSDTVWQTNSFLSESGQMPLRLTFINDDHQAPATEDNATTAALHVDLLQQCQQLFSTDNDGDT